VGPIETIAVPARNVGVSAFAVVPNDANAMPSALLLSESIRNRRSNSSLPSVLQTNIW
jgi:hypothetical protein